MSEDDFNVTGLLWSDLEALYLDYLKEIPLLELAGTTIVNQLLKLKTIHSVRFRVKDPEHLIIKIIRKKIDNRDRVISIDNYKTEITDLIGVRALHLFKGEALPIHTYVDKNWNLKETPTAYIRVGDPQSYVDNFEKYGCEVKVHPFGYRSLHFVVETKPLKQLYYAEIQVRTIFEEGWSEIDHSIRYPNNIDNPIYSDFLSILNRLAGSADEMASFLLSLRLKLAEMKLEHHEKLEEKDKKIAELNKKISELNIASEDKEQIKEAIGEISSPTKDISQWYTANSGNLSALAAALTSSPLMQAAMKASEMSSLIKTSPLVEAAIRAGEISASLSNSPLLDGINKFNQRNDTLSKSALGLDKRGLL